MAYATAALLEGFGMIEFLTYAQALALTYTFELSVW